jgi:hypothetical protein
MSRRARRNHATAYEKGKDSGGTAMKVLSRDETSLWCHQHQISLSDFGLPEKWGQTIFALLSWRALVAPSPTRPGDSH